MQDPDFAQLKVELMARGFQPTRLGFVAKIVRRLLWPFIRPFHFFNLERIVDVEKRLNQIEKRLNQLSDNQPDFIVAHAELRSEVAALVNRLTSIEQGPGPRNKLVLANTSNGVFLLKSGEIISDSIARGDMWDAHIAELIEDVSRKRDDLAIDVGAHFGYLSAVMAQHFQHVMSFEPNDFNYRMLVANMSINRFLNVDCINDALFSKSASLSLGKNDQQEIPLPLDSAGQFDGLLGSNLGAYLFTEKGSGFFPTEARTLDSYNLDNVAFIKIDVQGADGEVIKGAVETIRICRPVIVFEWEEHLSTKFATTLKDVKNLFDDVGYVVEVFKQHNEKQIDFIARPVDH